MVDTCLLWNHLYFLSCLAFCVWSIICFLFHCLFFIIVTTYKASLIVLHMAMSCGPAKNRIGVKNIVKNPFDYVIWQIYFLLYLFLLWLTWRHFWWVLCLVVLSCKLIQYLSLKFDHQLFVFYFCFSFWTSDGHLWPLFLLQILSASV